MRDLCACIGKWAESRNANQRTADVLPQAGVATCRRVRRQNLRHERFPTRTKPSYGGRSPPAVRIFSRVEIRSVRSVCLSSAPGARNVPLLEYRIRVTDGT